MQWVFLSRHSACFVNDARISGLLETDFPRSDANQRENIMNEKVLDWISLFLILTILSFTMPLHLW